MANKQEIFKEIDESPIKSYTKDLVKGIVNRVKHEYDKPSHLKVGDVFVYTLGAKRRPVVIAAIKDTLVYGIPLSTTQDEMNLIPSRSRFFKEGYFSNTLVTVKESVAMENFVGVFDNEKQVRKARRQLKESLDKVLE